VYVLIFKCIFVDIQQQHIECSRQYWYPSFPEEVYCSPLSQQVKWNEHNILSRFFTWQQNLFYRFD